MNRYEAISCRKSIRQYDFTPIPEKTRQHMEYFLKSVQALDKSIGCRIEIVDNTGHNAKISGLWKVEAPYYLVFWSEKKPGYKRNAGFMMEQMILYLTLKGIGSCYLGATRVAIEAERTDGEQMVQVIVASFGLPEKKLYRDANQAKRLPLQELCIFKEEVGEDIKSVLRAARLAPSSFNSQPWRFVVYENRIHIFAKKESLTGKLGLSMQELNLGIMMDHLLVAAEELWMKAEFRFEEKIGEKIYKNCEYITTLLIA